jgi:hypothetical protein
VRTLLAYTRTGFAIATGAGPSLLSDLVELPDALKCRVFDLLGIHAGVAQWCPGWCPCGVDLDADQLAGALAAAA